MEKGKEEGMSVWDSCSLRFVPDLSFNLFQSGRVNNIKLHLSTKLSLHR